MLMFVSDRTMHLPTINCILLYADTILDKLQDVALGESLSSYTNDGAPLTAIQIQVYC